MKFTTSIAALVLAASVVSGVAILEPNEILAREAEAKCWKPGQPCGKVKRAAEAFAEAVAEPKCWKPGQPCGRAAEPEAEAGILARCNMVGGPCFEAKRQIRDLANVVALTVREPEAFLEGLDIESRDVTDLVAREAEAKCWKLGQPCGRSAGPEALAEAEAKCWKPGQPCGKLKRAAEAVAAAVAEAEPKCWKPGQPCGRSAAPEAVAEAEAKCWKPGQPCGKAKRDELALRAISGAILA